MWLAYRRWNRSTNPPKNHSTYIRTTGSLVYYISFFFKWLTRLVSFWQSSLKVVRARSMKVCVNCYIKRASSPTRTRGVIGSLKCNIKAIHESRYKLGCRESSSGIWSRANLLCNPFSRCKPSTLFALNLLTIQEAYHNRLSKVYINALKTLTRSIYTLFMITTRQKQLKYLRSTCRMWRTSSSVAFIIYYRADKALPKWLQWSPDGKAFVVVRRTRTTRECWNTRGNIF